MTKKRILTSDIGGTNARFSYFSTDKTGQLKQEDSKWIKCHAISSFKELIDALRDSDFSLKPEDCDIAIIAAAGPVKAKRYCKPSNLDWAIDLSNAKHDFGFDRSLMINDFVAQAYACKTQAVSDAKVLQQGGLNPDAPLAVMGAGTGLGVCGLMPDGHGGFMPIPSEGGHTVLGFIGREEVELENFILQKLNVPFVYGDILLSGLGLSLIHEFVYKEKLEPAEVGAKLDVARKTTRLFARFYGRMCKNYVLSIMATGGLYISGGVSAKNHQLVEHPEFLREFTLSPVHSKILQGISVYENNNEESGLWGAALAGLFALQS